VAGGGVIEGRGLMEDFMEVGKIYAWQV
jgi:hypothetical protein